MSTYHDIAHTIRSNAKKLLAAKKIEVSLKNLGELYYTGSYTLDLMTWNDIDMQLTLKNGLNPTDVLGDFFKQISKDSSFVEAQMIHFKNNYKPKMPRGVYLGIKLDTPEYGGVWKLDIWVLSKEDFEKNRALIQTLQAKLDHETRELILDLKHEMMKAGDRVPQMGSHLLYQAILLDGIRDRRQLYAWLSNQGIHLTQEKG